MTIFDATVNEVMRPDPPRVRPGDRLHDVERLLAEHGVSGVAVVDDEGRALGVISRTDLLAQGTVRAVTGLPGRRVMIPDKAVQEVMTSEVISVAPDAPITEAAAVMRKHRIHRVLVLEEGRAVGAVTAWDVMALLASSDVDTAVGTLMSSNVHVVSVSVDTRYAVERLREAEIHGLVVADRRWPVGVFTQEEALVAECYPGESKVGDWMNPAVITVAPHMSVHHAAAQAVATRAQYLVVMDTEGIGGVVTPTDFLAIS